MGKKKTVIIDDSLPTEEVKEPRKKLNPNPAAEPAVESSRAKLNPNRAKLNPNKANSEQVTADSKKQEEPIVKKAEKKEEKKEVKVTHGQKYQEMREKVERNKPYAVAAAVELAKEVS